MPGDARVTGLRVHAADAASWRAVRDTRLCALTDSPRSFAATHAAESALTDADWLARVRRDAWFLARSGAAAIGIVAVRIDVPTSGEARLLSLWVAPGHRGSPAAGELVAAACRWARDRGARCVTLWLADGNPRARRFYERVGFTGTAERQPHPSDPQVGEEKMRRNLADA